MKISLNWLRDHIDCQESPETIADLLTGTGLEVEGAEEVSSIPGGLKGLVVGEILTCEPIPDTDHLNHTTVNVGADEVLSIVCGASNVAAGQKVVVAVPGTTLYPVTGEPFVIGKRKLRGVPSEGMICAEDEIGLGQDHSGIIVLDASIEVGTSVADLYGVDTDTVFEIGLTANRGDAASHRGVARDLSAVLDLDLKTRKDQPETYSGNSNWSIHLEDPACPRYTGLLMENIEVKESPDWLKNRLRALGLNPINNIVDITNFVLHDIGQPIHAFDADKIKGDKIIVKKALPGSSFVTLDEEERTLSGEELMICNADEPMAIAGVFGGKESGVSASTKRIFIESAYFDPASIRKTAKHHGLSTDASFRYERGTDPEITVAALKRVACLVEEIAGGRVASPIIDEYPVPVPDFVVRLEKDYLKSLAGVEIGEAEVLRILDRLEIKKVEHDELGWVFRVPAFKSDVNRPADLVEELVRIHGLDKIPFPEMVHSSYSHRRRPDMPLLRRKMARHLVSRGFYETSTNSMTASKYYPETVLEHAVRILNPLSGDTEILRPGMLVSLLQSMAWNKNRKNPDLKLFELGKVYRSKEDGSYFEEQRLGILVCGNWFGESWHRDSLKSDLYLLKQEVEVLLDRLGMQARPSKWSFDPFRETGASQAWIQVGKVHPSLLKMMDIQGEAWYAELNWDTLCSGLKENIRMELKPAPKFPAVRRDLSVVLDQSVGMDTLNKLINQVNKGLIREVNVFDVYQGDKLEDGKKSYSISFLIRDEEKTLNEKEIDSLMNKLITTFEKQAGALIRK